MLFRLTLTYSENVKLFDIIFNESDFKLCEKASWEIQLGEIFKL